MPITFEHLFGTRPEKIKPLCVISPYLSKGLLKDLKITNLSKRPFATGSNDQFSFIHSQIGAPMVGDAVLYLKQTPCTHIIFLGSCGAVQETKGIQIGSLVTPSKSLNLESFSTLLIKKTAKPQAFKADPAFLQKFRNATNGTPPHTVTCASMGSIKLEDAYKTFLKKNKVDVVEMECSALFAAAGHINRKALALLYVTDILKKKHIFAPLNQKDHDKIHHAQKKITEILFTFSETIT